MVEIDRKAKDLIGTTERAEDLGKRLGQLNFLRQHMDMVDNFGDDEIVNNVLNSVGEHDDDDAVGPVNNLNRSQDDTSVKQIAVRTDLGGDRCGTNARNDIRNATQPMPLFDVRNESRNDIQNDNNLSGNSSDGRFDGNHRVQNYRNDREHSNVHRNDRLENYPDYHRNDRIDNRINKHLQNTSVPESPASPMSPMSPMSPISASSIPSSSQPRIEERIALSDKFKRRKRVEEPHPTKNNESMQSHDQRNVNGLQPQQDPRLRNRPNVPTTNDFQALIALGNSQAKPPIQHPSMQNSFGNNFNMNHPQNSEVYPPQRPFFNEPFSPVNPPVYPPVHQQPQSHPQARPSANIPIHSNLHGNHHASPNQQNHPHRPGQHFTSPSNNYNTNVVCGPNAMPQHPRMNPFVQNSNSHQHQNHSRNHQQHQRQAHPRKETYSDHRHRLKMEAKRKQDEARTAAAAVSSTTSQNNIGEQNKESESQQSRSNSPNRTETATGKSAEKPKTPNSAPKSIFDKAFESNNWDTLPKSVSKSFKIPKKIQPNSENKSRDDKRDASENNVSTSTKPGKVHKSSSNLDRLKASSPLNRKKSTDTGDKRKSTDGKKSSKDKDREREKEKEKEKDKKSSKKSIENNQIHADTTINIESEVDTTKSANKTTENEQSNKSIPDLDDVLKLLAEKFDPAKLEQVKKLLAPTDQTNDDAVTSSTQPGQNNAENEATNVSRENKSKSDAPKTPKRSRELERLNADIRENIPDVLSATGRRACTLNAQKSNESSPTKPTKSAAEKSKASTELKSDDEFVCDNSMCNQNLKIITNYFKKKAIQKF